MTGQQRLDRAVRAAWDAFTWHPECPPMTDGTEGGYTAMQAALLAAGFDPEREGEGQ